MPIFTICRKLFGLTVYKNPPKEPQIEIDDSYFIAKALITEYTRASRVAEHEDALLKMRPEEEEELDRYKDFPKEFIFKEKVFKKPATANLQYTFKNDTLYIRNPENEKDVWIVDGGDSPEYKNVFYIDWTDENNAFQKSDYEVIKVKGKKMLINRISNAIFDMPGGKIHLDMLINDNDGVKQLLSSSSAAEEQSKEHTVFTAADNTQYKIEGDFRPVYPDVKKVEAPNGEKMVIKPVRNRGGQEPEIRLAEELKHVGIVIGKLIQDNKGNKFLLMPYINGEALEGFAKREDIPLKDKLRGFSEIVSDLTEILAYLESLGYSYNDSRFSPQFDRHFIIEDSTRKLKLIDFEQVREEKNQYRRWLHNAIVLIDTVELLKNSLPVSLQNKFEQDLGLLYGKARNEDAVNNDKSKDPYQELCKKLKALINEIKDSLAEETSQEVALSADSPATISPKGGIDFTRPDIVTRQTNGLQSLVSGPLSINPDLDFEAEWSGIQTVFNAGIRPSTRRMAEFAASVAGSPMNSRRLDDLLGLIADILRREEEDEKLIPSDPALKELLTNL